MATVICPICTDDDTGLPREFKSEGALRMHNRNKHPVIERCPVCGDEFANLPSHMRRHTNADAKAQAAARSDATQAGTSAAGPVASDEPDDDAPSSERRPTVPFDLPPDAPPSRRKVKDRVRAKLWGKAADDDTSPPAGSAYASPERKPKRAGARASTAPIMSMLWGGAGTVLVRSGADTGVGRVMQFQQAMAGDVLDRLIQRTWLDRLIQPIASKTDDVEAVGALFGMLVLVAAMERAGPDAAQSMVPILREAVKANITAMAPVVKKRKADEAKFAKAVEDLNIITPDGVDPVDAIIMEIFAPPPGMTDAPPAADQYPSAVAL